MKKIVTGSCLLLAGNILIAQAPAIDTSDKKSLFEGTINNSFLSQGKYSHTTSKGKVYTLPYDNMPCLVPDMQSVAPMPGSVQRFPESRMPNAIPRRNLIPKQKRSSE